MQKSWQEVRKQCIKENIELYHPYVTFVLFSGKKCICEDHPNLNMKIGQIKQHIEGSAHNLNFETGEPLEAPNFENVSKTLEKEISQSKNLSKPSLDYKLRQFLISCEKDPVKQLYMTYCYFEGKKREEEMAKIVFNHIKEESTNQCLRFMIENQDMLKKEENKEISRWLEKTYHSFKNMKI